MVVQHQFAENCEQQSDEDYQSKGETDIPEWGTAPNECVVRRFGLGCGCRFQFFSRGNLLPSQSPAFLTQHPYVTDIVVGPTSYR